MAKWGTNQDVDINGGGTRRGIFAVLCGADNELVSVGGFIIQRYPGGDDAALWVNLEGVGVALDNGVGDFLHSVGIGRGDLDHFQTGWPVFIDFRVVDAIDKLKRQKETVAL